jgi:hypothetical protein
MITTKRVGGIRFTRIGRHQFSYCRCRAVAVPAQAPQGALRFAALTAAACAAFAAFALLTTPPRSVTPERASAAPLALPAPAPLALIAPAAAAVPLPAPRPRWTLADAVYSVRGARPTVRAAIAFDVCAGEAGGAREEWLGPKRRRAYDRIKARLDAVYAADPRDGAVHRAHRTFCRAAFRA